MSEEKTRGPGPREAGGANAQRPASPQPLDLVASKLTDVGRARPHNEDYVDYYIPPDPRQLARKGVIYLVADGMGGHQAGEVASQGAVELVIGQYYSDTTHDIGTSLVRAFRAANQQIHAQAQADPTKGGMGTTLVAAVILGQKVYVANVGDSRAYLINKQGIAQITEDHSWVEEQVRAGLLTAEQAKRHPQRNLVTRALGSKPAVEVDLFEGEINAGDMLLLCSDGLTGRVEDQELAATVREHPPQRAARLLVDLANERGGNDNISVLIVSAQEEPATVKAPVLAPPEKKPARRSPLVPILAGTAALLVLVIGGLLGIRFLRDRGGVTPVPSASPVVMATTVTSTAEILPTEEISPTGEATTTPMVTLPVSPTSSVSPTVTLAPTPTNTPKPTNTPVPAAGTKEPTHTPQTAYSHQAPTLAEPTPDAELSGEATFRWNYQLSRLGTGNSFQVLIWREGEHKGAAQLVRTLEQTINLDYVAQVTSGGPGEYFWSVVVVRESDEKRLSEEAAPRRFIYTGAQSQTGGEEKTKPGEPQPPDECGNCNCDDLCRDPNSCHQCCQRCCPGYPCKG